jgi:hypothetical protein
MADQRRKNPTFNYKALVLQESLGGWDEVTKSFLTETQTVVLDEWDPTDAIFDRQSPEEFVGVPYLEWRRTHRVY